MNKNSDNPAEVEGGLPSTDWNELGGAGIDQLHSRSSRQRTKSNGASAAEGTPRPPVPRSAAPEKHAAAAAALASDSSSQQSRALENAASQNEDAEAEASGDDGGAEGAAAGVEKDAAAQHGVRRSGRTRTKSAHALVNEAAQAAGREVVAEASPVDEGAARGPSAKPSWLSLDEMKRLMRVYGPLTCVRDRAPTKGTTPDVASVRRKFHRWFTDLEERFVRTEDGSYQPKAGHEAEKAYREEKRKADQRSLAKKRNSTRSSQCKEGNDTSIVEDVAEATRPALAPGSSGVELEEGGAAVDTSAAAAEGESQSASAAATPPKIELSGNTAPRLANLDKTTVASVLARLDPLSAPSVDACVSMVRGRGKLAVAPSVLRSAVANNSKEEALQAIIDWRYLSKDQQKTEKTVYMKLGKHPRDRRRGRDDKDTPLLEGLEQSTPLLDGYYDAMEEAFAEQSNSAECSPLYSSIVDLDGVSFAVFANTGGGACLFKAGSQHINAGDESFHEQVRETVCDIIRDPRNSVFDFSAVMEGGDGVEDILSVQQYVSIMRQPRTHGGEQEILAFALLCSTRVMVYDRGLRQPRVIPELGSDIDNCIDETNPPMLLYRTHIRGEIYHYELLERISEERLLLVDASIREESASLSVPGAAADVSMGAEHASIREKNASLPLASNSEQHGNDLDCFSIDLEVTDGEPIGAMFEDILPLGDKLGDELGVDGMDIARVESLDGTGIAREGSLPHESSKKHNPAKKKKRDDRRERRVTESARRKKKQKKEKREDERRRKERDLAKQKSREDEMALEDASSGLGDDSAASSSSSTDDGTNLKGSAPKPASHEGVPLQQQQKLLQTIEQEMKQPTGLMRYAKVPMAQWPPWLRELHDADPGDLLRRFAMDQQEYADLESLLEQGGDLVPPESETHDLSHICFVAVLNFCSNTREQRRQRLLSRKEDGTLVEPCLQATTDFLVDALVVGHGVPRENAEFLVRECTAFLNRTLETGPSNWCSADSSSYPRRVATTDGLTRELARKCVGQFPAGVYIFTFGEHSYNAVIKGLEQSEGPWFDGMNVWILQTSSWTHPAVWLNNWGTEQQRDTVVGGGSLVVAHAMGVQAPRLTKEKRAQILVAMSRESERRRNIAAEKSRAKNRGHCIWAKARCLRKDDDGNVCGCIIEASLESFDRPAGMRPGTNSRRHIPTHHCPGNSSRGCLGYPDESGGYKKGNKARHRLWEVLTVLEVLKCCKGNEVAKGRLVEFGHGDCICVQCMPSAEEADEDSSKSPAIALKVASASQQQSPPFQAALTNVIISSPPRLPFFLESTEPAKVRKSYRTLSGIAGRLFWWYSLRKEGKFIQKFSERNLVGDAANLGEKWTPNCLEAAAMHGGRSRYSTFAFLAGTLQDGCLDSLNTLKETGVTIDFIRGTDKRRNRAKSWFWKKATSTKEGDTAQPEETIQQYVNKQGNRGSALFVGGRISLAWEDATGYSKALLELLCE